MIAPWLAADWPAPPGVRAFTTLRHGTGVSEPPFDAFNLGNRHAADGDDPVVVERNRALLVEHARLPSTPFWLRQVHGTHAIRCDGPASTSFQPADIASERSAPREPGARKRVTTPPAFTGEGVKSAEPEADAAVTSVPGAVLAILTADCLPVLFCADDGSEVAAAHAGWRGLAGGVLEATLAAMRTPASRVRAWLGPAAGPQQYEVGIEVFDAFVAPDWQAAGAFASTRPGHWRVDLYALARRRLTRAGVAPEHISGGGFCTISEPGHFFSHRRDRRTGRMASLVWIEPAPRA